MAIFGSWLDDLLNGSSQPQPAVASGLLPTQPAAWRVPMQTPDVQPQASQSTQPSTTPSAPDALTALAQAQAKSAQTPSWWRQGLGIIGGGLHDFAMSRAGRPDLATGISDYYGDIDQRQKAALAAAAQGQVFSSMAGTGAGSQLPPDTPLQIAKLSALGVDVGPIKDYLSTRAAMLPKYDYKDAGNQTYRVDQFGNVVPFGAPKPVSVTPGQGSFQPDALPGAIGLPSDGGGAPTASADASAQPAAAPPLPTGDQVAGHLMQAFPGSEVTSGKRTAAKNAAVNGVPNSAHLQDTPTTWARDLQGGGIETADNAAAINALGIPGLKALYEGPGAKNSTGPHLHVQYIAPAGGGASPSVTPGAPPGGHWLVQPQGTIPIDKADPSLKAAYPGAVAVSPDGKPIYPPAATAAANAPQDTSTIDYWAHSVASGGPMPTLGMGAQAASIRQAILKRAAEINTAAGLGGADQNVNVASTKANSSALAKQTQLRSATEGFENTMLQNMNIARDMLKKGSGTTGIPIMNRFQQYMRGEYAGDPDVVALNNAIDTVADENAKIRSGTLGNTPATDSMRANIKSGLNGAMTPQQIEAAFQVMERDAANRTRALRAQEDALKSALHGGSGKPNIPGIQDNPPALQDLPRTTQPSSGKFIEGGVYRDANGNRARYQGGKWIPVQ